MNFLSSTVFAAPYEVIETDYDSYSCVYSCIEMSGYKAESASSSPAPHRLPVQRTTSAPPSSARTESTSPHSVMLLIRRMRLQSIDIKFVTYIVTYIQTMYRNQI
ncbi:crustacyanin-A [Penaeus vannamei]|uniref:Crustacyanin-A n=1 Tax=Penaeus vannamei TaxID=6689 RepID=A0A3R7MIW6_PENVA|nr:crustacyanin-A [Penaeus vannamei]